MYGQDFFSVLYFAVTADLICKANLCTRVLLVVHSVRQVLHEEGDCQA